MMDKFNAINEIMTLLNEEGLLIPGDRAHDIVTAYLSFKIDRLGPEKALDDVVQDKSHIIAQIRQMSM